MAVNRTFLSKTCGECLVFFETGDIDCGQCRLNPPTLINAYTSAYPIVRSTMPGCGCGVTKPKPKAKPKKGKTDA